MKVPVLITPPAVEPVSVAEAKAHLRIEHASDDTYLGSLITAAREQIEALTWRSLINTTWEIALDEFPGSDVIRLTKGRLQSVTSVTYLDEFEQAQTFPSSSYTANTRVEPGEIVLDHDAEWPETADIVNAVVIRFVAGYGAAAASVPVSLGQAILLLVAHLYEHREPEVTGTIVAQMGFSWQALISPYRVKEF